MAEAGTGRGGSAAVAPSSSLSTARAASVSVKFTQLSSVDGRALAFGSAATTPATYGGLTGGTQGPLAETAPVTVANHPGGGGYDATVLQDLSAGYMASLTAGHHLYACLFNVAPAISGSVPAIVVDFGVLS